MLEVFQNYARTLYSIVCIEYSINMLVLLKSYGCDIIYLVTICSSINLRTCTENYYVYTFLISPIRIGSVSLEINRAYLVKISSIILA